MNLYRRLLKLLKPHWHRLAIAMICMVGAALCTAALPYLIKPVIDDIFVNKREEMLKFLAIVVLLVFAGKGLSDWGQAYFMSYVGQRIIVQLRQQLYDHLQRLSLSFFHRAHRGKCCRHASGQNRDSVSAAPGSPSSTARASLFPEPTEAALPLCEQFVTAHQATVMALSSNWHRSDILHA